MKCIWKREYEVCVECGMWNVEYEVYVECEIRNGYVHASETHVFVH